MAKTNFCELRDIPSEQTFLLNSGTAGIFFQKPRLDFCGTLICGPFNMTGALLHLHFEYSHSFYHKGIFLCYFQERSHTPVLNAVNPSRLARSWWVTWPYTVSCVPTRVRSRGVRPGSNRKLISRDIGRSYTHRRRKRNTISVIYAKQGKSEYSH